MNQADMGARRRLVYLLAGCGLVLSYVFLRGAEWQGAAALHTAMESVATLLALTVGAMALIHYYSKKNNTFLFIGAGFLGSAFLDGYHAIVTSAVFQPLMPSDLPALIPWSWIASRQFLSIFLFLSWLAWLRERRHGEAGRFDDWQVYLFASVFTLASFAFFVLAPLPRAYYPEFLFHRPEEFLPALFFAAALGGYLSKGHWRHNTFEHWLVLSLIVSVVGQAVFMSFSGLLFDLEFDMAHLLKKISYVCVLTGLLASMYSTFKLEASHGEALGNARRGMNAAHERLLALDHHIIIAVTNSRGAITYVNDNFCRISKYDRDELIGVHHRILASGHHPPPFFAEMYKTIAEGNVWHGEIKNRAKDGSDYWVDATIAPFKDRDGDFTHHMAIWTDITSRKNAEDELGKKAGILKTTFTNFPSGISVVSSDLKLQVANPAFYRLLNLPEEKFPVGARYEDIIRFNAERGEYGEGDPGELVGMRLELAAKFEAHSFKRIRPDGISLEIKGWPLPEGGFITIYTDISDIEDMMVALEEKSREAVNTAMDLRQARDVQNQTHQHLLTAINSMRNGFAIWNRNDRLMLANEAYQNIHQQIREIIVVGLKFEELLSAGYDRNLWDTAGTSKPDWIAMKMAHRRSARESEQELRLADGRQLVIAHRLLDNGDIIATIIDVTAHRERESELQSAKQRLEKIAYFDTLTGLANRAHCQSDLSERFASVKPDSQFAIIQIDLDNFKRVNDTLGHAAGDYLLRAVGDRLSLLTDEFENFMPYRWGGDEFIAVVEEQEDTDLGAICQELTDIIAIPLEFEGSVLRPTVSLGVARYPLDGVDLEALMIFADLALYKTKELGRDGYQFFTAEMKEKIDAESQVERELRVAVEEGQLELYYQPQLNVNDETITGLEALLRWNHPERGLISPADFLPVVEMTDLAPVVGCQVFDIAMAAARCWVDEGIEFGRLAVNLSPEHLRRNSVLDDFFDSLDKHGVAPKLLAVEFLESFLFDDPDADVMDVLKQLRARDVHVELDDFGTGYASLSHLSTMPIDGLKIDRSFIHQILNDDKQQGIVSMLISLSKLMDLRVVCEGIETRQQVEAVAEIGKCSVQGYFIAKPMSFEDTTKWIKERRNIGTLGALPDMSVKIA